MIVPMKKASILVQAKDANETIWLLRSLGVLHVEHQAPPKGKEVNLLKDDLMLVEKALGILEVERSSARNMKEEIKGLNQWARIAKHIVDLRNRFDQLEEYSANMRKTISQWEAWGNFDPAGINRLAERGIYVRLYQVPVKELKYFPSSVIVRVTSRIGSIANCAAISREKIEVPFKELTLPKMGIGEMRKRLAEDGEVLAALKLRLERHARHYDDFLRVKKVLEKELEFSEALCGMGQAGSIAYIVGYVPYNKEKIVIESAERHGWGVLVSDPSDEDRVPTLIRNPKWVSIIKPVFKLLEIFPGYRELDISPFFLIFLGLFFGMIIGDAGYGTLYILLTFLGQKRLGRKMKDKTIFRLLYFFSACAIFWGILTGTVFGQEWYLKAGFRPLIPVLNDTKFLQAFCFFLGAFHLTLGHGLQAIRKAPSLTAIADAGWIMVLWSAFFFAKMLILNDPLPQFIKLVLIAGISLVIVFTSPHRNILKTVVGGLGTVALNIMNNFTDVVSYVRLFAVGLAGVAISDTVNTLASVFAGDNILMRVAILFIGHTINIILGPVSVMVHGIRLNVLEFSGHVGLTWSGTPYKPLQSLEEG